jgi:hypothetical protein
MPPLRAYFDEYGAYRVYRLDQLVESGRVAAQTDGALAFTIQQLGLPDVRTGDVWVDGRNGDTHGDMLRFTDGNGDISGRVKADRLIFYSLSGDTDPPIPGRTLLADVAVFPGNAGTGLVRNLDLNKREGDEGTVGRFEWAPAGGDPGVRMDGQRQLIRYIGYSDGQVPNPEPSTFVVAALSVVIGLVYRRLRKRKSEQAGRIVARHSFA